MRARIFAAARALFAHEGYEGMSMRKLATAAECAPAALYSYFPNKRAVLHVLWEDIFADLAARLADVAAATPDPVARLEGLTTTFVGYWLDHPDDYRAIFLIEDKLTSPGDTYFAQTSPSMQGITLVHDAAEEALAAGLIKAASADEVAAMLLTAANGLALNLITIPEFDWGDGPTLATRMIATLVAGLKS